MLWLKQRESSGVARGGTGAMAPSLKFPNFDVKIRYFYQNIQKFFQRRGRSPRTPITVFKTVLNHTKTRQICLLLCVFPLSMT